MKTSRFILIGLVIVSAIGLLVYGLNYMKGEDFFQPKNNYFVEYQNIQGLMVSNPVLINGYKVGQISDIRIQLEKPEKSILVEFNIDPNIRLNDSSVARIYSLNLMGGKGIDLKIGNGKKILETGSVLISAVEEDLKDQVSAQMLPLKLKAEDLMSSIEDAMKVVRKLFNKTNISNIEGTLKNLNKTFTTLNHTSQELDMLLTNNRDTLSRIFSNVESLTKNLSNNNEQINLILNNLALVSDSLAKSQILSTINNANATLAQTDSIMQKINNGEGSIGQLINNKQLYQNLEDASKNLDKLLIDIKENPKRYIHYSLFDFGKTIVVDEKGLKEEKKKKKRKKDKNNDTSYLLQIKSSLDRIRLDSKEFKGLKDIQEHYVDGRYKYTIHSNPSFSKMKELRKEVLHLFPDAFITKYQQDSLIVSN